MSAVHLDHLATARTKPRVRRERQLAPWTERLLLDDGRQLLLRPIQPADAEPIRHAFRLLSPEEVRMRFLHPMKEISSELVKRLTRIEPENEFALVIAEPLPPGEALVGCVGRLSIDKGTDRAEFAVLVSHFLIGKGLGRLLMNQLIAWGRARGLSEIYGDVLDENSAMLSLAASLGFKREMLPDDPGIVRVRLKLKS
ncbi:MAG: GNAT family N-acetyltransferase [Lysobacteraceae bacterium]